MPSSSEETGGIGSHMELEHPSTTNMILINQSNRGLSTVMTTMRIISLKSGLSPQMTVTVPPNPEQSGSMGQRISVIL